MIVTSPTNMSYSSILRRISFTISEDPETPPVTESIRGDSLNRWSLDNFSNIFFINPLLVLFGRSDSQE